MPRSLFFVSEEWLTQGEAGLVVRVERTVESMHREMALDSSASAPASMAVSAQARVEQQQAESVADRK